MTGMKVSQLMLAKGFGGAERYFVDLSLALADLGHEVQAICHHRFQGRELLARDPRIRLHTVSVLGWWDPLARYQVARAVARFGPQLMHAHLARAACIGGNVARRLRIPLAVKTHNYVDLKYYRDVDLFLPTTRDQRRYLLEQGIAPDRIEVLPNFSSLPPVTEDGLAASGGRPSVRFGTLGRMVKKKGFDLLIRAFHAALDQGLDAHLVIGGDGPERARLEQMIRDLDCVDRVTLSGWVDDAATFLSAIDVFVLPSLDEPFGIVVLEAMARGRIIISTRTQGPSEILDDSTACLVDAGDVPQLTSAMLNAATADGAALARRGWQKFRAQYSKEQVVPRLIKHYHSLAAKGSAK